MPAWSFRCALKAADLLQKNHRFTFALVLSMFFSVVAQAQINTPTGIQPASTNEFGIDLASSNIQLEIPLRSKSAGPIPLSVSLVANYGVRWTGEDPERTGVNPALVPTSMGLFGVTVNGTATYSVCRTGYDVWTLTVNGVTDSSGTYHSLSNSFLIGPSTWEGGSCPFSSSGQGTVHDGSGYTIQGSYNNGWNITVYDPSGNVARASSAPLQPPANWGMSSMSTPDGVSVSFSGTGTSGTWTDALSSTPFLTQSSSSGTGIYSYTDASGNAQEYTVTSTTMTVQTNFGCGNLGNAWGDSGPSQGSLPTTITLPGSNGAYTITYEPTPGYPGNVTGRIASITYPSGGSVSYAYSGGNGNANGYDCYSGIVPKITVTTNDNNGNVGVWTYVSTRVGNPTPTSYTVTATGPPTPLSPSGDQTVYTFNYQYLTQVKSYQGSAAGGNLLLTTLICYNGNLSSCAVPSTPPATPITEKDTYTTPGTYSKSTRTQEEFNSTYGYKTYEAVYDYGAGTPTRQTYYYDGQSWNGTSCTAYAAGSQIWNTPCYVKTTDGSGNPLAQTQSTFSNTGHPTAVSSWVSGTTWLTTNLAYTAQGVLQSVTEPNGAITQYSNFACNSLVPETITLPISAAGSASTVTDCNGGVTTSATDVNGNTYTYHYNDPLYRFTSVTKPDGGSESVTYNQSSLPWTITSAKTINSSQTASATSKLDGFGKVTNLQVVDPSSSTGYSQVNLSYNNLGQKISATNPFFTTSDPTYGSYSYAYDALGRLIKLTYPDSTYASYAYSNRASQSVDPSGKTTITQANGLTSRSECLVTSVTQVNGAAPSSCGLDIAATGFLGSTNFDALGRVSSSSLSAETRSFSYDGLSRLTSEVTPETGTTTFTYDTGTAGDLYQRVTAVATTTYAWDLMHRSLSLSYSDGVTPTVNYSYDQPSAMGQSLYNYKGELTYAATGGTTTNTQLAFSYDAMGRNNNMWSCVPLTCGTSVQQIGAVYNYDGSLQTFTDNSTFTNRSTPVTFTYAYNNAQNVTGVTSSYAPSGGSYPATLFTAGSYNAFGLLTNYTYASGALGNSTTMGYDTHGRNTSRTSGSLYSYSLTYNPNSSVSASNDSQNFSWQYTYDDFNRLSTAVELAPSNSYTYAYDQYGNRWGTSSTCTYTNQSACQYNFNTNNQATGLYYDAVGDVVSDVTHSNEYDAEGRLTHTATRVHRSTFVYDALGHRVQEEGTGGDYVSIFDFTGHLYQRELYISGSGLSFQWTQLYAGEMPVGAYTSSCSTCTGTAAFYLTDWRGTLAILTGPDGSSQGSCAGFLPYGDSSSCTGLGASGSEPGYAGTWLESETSPEDLNKTDTRYLLTTEGRFLTPDPARSGWNLYVYADDDPISKNDPSGLGPEPDGGCPGNSAGANGGPCNEESLQESQDPFTLCAPNPCGTPPIPNITDLTTPNNGTFTAESAPAINDSSCFGQCGGFSGSAPDSVKEYFLNWAKPVGAPSFAESLIPIWGSGRAAVNDFQTGHWGWGIVHSAMAVSDVFLVKSLATVGAKLAVAGATRLIATETAERAGIGWTGKIGEDALALLGGVKPTKAFSTPMGPRFVDRLVSGVAYESKVGYTAASARILKQVTKDAYLLNGSQEFASAEWHFFRSPVTGLVGPSEDLRNLLLNAGIKIVCPECP